MTILRDGPLLLWLLGVAVLAAVPIVIALRKRRPISQEKGPVDLGALGNAVFDSLARREFVAYQRLFVNPYRLESEPYRKGFQRLCGRVPRDARYEGLLVEQNGRAFLRVSLPNVLHEIQVGKAVKLESCYKLDDPVKGGRSHRDLDTVDLPTARPVVLKMDRSGMTPDPTDERRSNSSHAERRFPVSERQAKPRKK